MLQTLKQKITKGTRKNISSAPPFPHAAIKNKGQESKHMHADASVVSSVGFTFFSFRTQQSKKQAYYLK